MAYLWVKKALDTMTLEAKKELANELGVSYHNLTCVSNYFSAEVSGSTRV